MSEGPRLHDGDEREPVDPELVRLRRRAPVGPLLAASVLGFAILLMVRLRHDLAFSGQPETPVDLGRVADLRTMDLPEDGHVALAGELDARAPARLRGLQSAGRRLTPLLGTDGRIWIDEEGEANAVTPVYEGGFAGRLRRLDDAPFAGDLRAFVAGLPPLPRHVQPSALGPGLPDRDVHGDPLRVAADTPVSLEERVTGVALVTLVATDTIKDEPGARRALEAAGLAGRPVEKTDTSWTYEVALDATDAAARLRAARLHAGVAEAKRIVHQGQAGALRVDGDAVVLGDRRVPRAAVTLVTVLTPPAIPEDAWVLRSGDTPAALWYMRPVYGLLALIALLMVWALVVDLRHLRKQRADSPV